MHSTGFHSQVSRSSMHTSLKSLRAKPDPPYPPNTYIFEPMRVTECPPLIIGGVTKGVEVLIIELSLKSKQGQVVAERKLQVERQKFLAALFYFLLLNISPTLEWEHRANYA